MKDYNIFQAIAELILKFKYDFFYDDYFQKRFELNQDLFNQFFKQMDSLKGNFLRDNYPDKSNKK